CVFAPGAVQAIYGVIANDGRERSLSTFFVIEVDRDHRMRDLTDLDVSEVQVFEQTAAHRVVLNAQCVIEIGTIELAVLGEQIAHAARDLTTHCDAAMTVLHLTTLHDDVLSRRVKSSSVGVPS